MPQARRRRLEPERRILPEGGNLGGDDAGFVEAVTISLMLGNVAAATTLTEHYEVRNAGIHSIVIPAQAGIHWFSNQIWIPAFAGMTGVWPKLSPN